MIPFDPQRMPSPEVISPLFGFICAVLAATLFVAMIAYWAQCWGEKHGYKKGWRDCADWWVQADRDVEETQSLLRHNQSKKGKFL